MIPHNKNNKYNITELKWDTKFFEIPCGRLTLTEEIGYNDWSFISNEIKHFEFIVIKNLNSNSKNSKLLGEQTKSFLIDINIQFIKDISVPSIEEDIFILDKNSDLLYQLFSLANFNQSRFIKDENLLAKGGDKVYNEWVKNSFEHPDKNIIIVKNNLDVVLGFVLVLKSDEELIIELIAVNSKQKARGIGTSLINKAEIYAFKQGLKKIRVGTQITNIAAMNFYNKMKYRQYEVHQIYHLWNS